MNNNLEIKILISNYDEVIEKLENIKKLLNEIAGINIQIEVNN